MSKKEREMCDYEMDFKKSFFCYFSNLSNDDKISWRPGLKTGMKSANFWSELGSGFGELGSTPPPGLPRNTPPGLRRSDPQPHRNISELTLSFLCGIWLIFVAKGPLVETKGCLLLGSNESL